MGFNSGFKGLTTDHKQQQYSTSYMEGVRHFTCMVHETTFQFGGGGATDKV